jgi:uncharacterized protein (TIGR00730 family)
VRLPKAWHVADSRRAMLKLMIRSVCVFCRSNFGNLDVYRTAAADLGSLLAMRGIRLVYGGATVGLMGTIANACLSKGGEVIGVIPQGLVDKEIAHPGLTELRIVQTMHERKALMADLSDGFIALPGGTGTFEEFFEVASWSQLGLQRKPCALVNIAGYYDGLLSQADRAVRDGFLTTLHRSMLLTHHIPESVLDLLLEHVPPTVERWISKAER